MLHEEKPPCHLPFSLCMTPQQAHLRKVHSKENKRHQQHAVQLRGTICVDHDFYPQDRIAWTRVAGDRCLSISIYPSIGTSIWQLAQSLVKPAHSPAVLAGCCGTSPVSDIIQSISLLFSSKCCGFLPLRGARWAFTQQGTQLLPLIQFPIT